MDFLSWMYGAYLTRISADDLHDLTSVGNQDFLETIQRLQLLYVTGFIFNALLGGSFFCKGEFEVMEVLLKKNGWMDGYMHVDIDGVLKTHLLVWRVGLLMKLQDT